VELSIAMSRRGRENNGAECGAGTEPRAEITEMGLSL